MLTKTVCKKSSFCISGVSLKGQCRQAKTISAHRGPAYTNFAVSLVLRFWVTIQERRHKQWHFTQVIAKSWGSVLLSVAFCRQHMGCGPSLSSDEKEFVPKWTYHSAHLTLETPCNLEFGLIVALFA